MFYTLAGAVKATGVSKSAILRAIECGRITGTKDLFGEWRIEGIELQRLCPALAKGGPATSTALSHAAAKAPTLEAEIQTLISQAGDSLRQRCDDVRPAPQVDHAEAQVRCGIPDLWAVTPAPRSSASGSAGAPHTVLELPQLALGLAEACRDARSATIDPIGLAAPVGSAWDHEIGSRPYDGFVPDLPVRNRRVRAASITAALLAALALGWIGGSSSGLHETNPIAGPEKASVNPGESDQPALGASNSRRSAAPGTRRGSHASERPQGAAQAASAAPIPPAARENPAASGLPGMAQSAKSWPKRAPVPETRPATIEGWTVREVLGGTAILEGPNGTWKVTRGDTVPGVGRVDSIVRWGKHWVVATSRGLIATQ